jgi:hypothetical protein
MIAELFGGVVTDYLLRRTRSQQIARSLLIRGQLGLCPGGAWCRRSSSTIEQRFAQDSPLEGDGFELSVPRQ